MKRIYLVFGCLAVVLLLGLVMRPAEKVVPEKDICGAEKRKVVLCEQSRVLCEQNSLMLEKTKEDLSKELKSCQDEAILYKVIEANQIKAN